jgi:hypothetical protein
VGITNLVPNFIYPRKRIIVSNRNTTSHGNKHLNSADSDSNTAGRTTRTEAAIGASWNIAKTNKSRTETGLASSSLAHGPFCESHPTRIGNPLTSVPILSACVINDCTAHSDRLLTRGSTRGLVQRVCLPLGLVLLAAGHGGLFRAAHTGRPTPEGDFKTTDTVACCPSSTPTNGYKTTHTEGTEK